MNNHMGSKATADEAVMTAVLGYLKSHGKLFVDSRTTAGTAAPRIAAWSSGCPSFSGRLHRRRRR